MTIPLSLGYSTCPNDTLVFYALAHGKIDTRGYEFKIELADVETLNQKAATGSLDITKLSVAALGNLSDRYVPLRSGAALGRGCGPLIVARPGTDLSALAGKPVAVPGLFTTAALLLGLYAPKKPQMIPMPFDAIMPALQKGAIDLGVIIHEGRFTYERYGLTCLLDLGKWWEETTGLPIPLGCIAARKGLTEKVIQDVEEMIRESVVYGRKHPREAERYVAGHAQEMEKDVMDRHIALYVNDFTVDFGEEGETAIRRLLGKAGEKRLFP